MQALLMCAWVLASTTPTLTPTQPVVATETAGPTPGEEPAPRRPAVSVSRPGVPNLYQVSETLYRGGQPTAQGYEELRKLGIKTVVNLRSFRDDADVVKRAKLEYLRIDVDGWQPSHDEIVEFLQIVTDEEKTPVFVHCRRGADRTGVMAAAYRVVVEDWPQSAAIEEMTEGPFGFHEAWTDLRGYVEQLDMEALARDAGVDDVQ